MVKLKIIWTQSNSLLWHKTSAWLE